MPIQDIVVLIILAIVAAVAVFLVFKNRGKCPGGCEGCAYRGECHRKKPKRKK